MKQFGTNIDVILMSCLYILNIADGSAHIYNKNFNGVTISYIILTILCGLVVWDLWKNQH